MSDGIEHFLDSEGVWCEILPGACRGGAALFLDRDGVVVREINYLHRVEDIVMIPGASTIIKAANARAIPVVLVTNQSGIGRGYYGWQEFHEVQRAIMATLSSAGARVDAVYASPHHSSGIPPYQHSNHPAPKPNPGMLLRAAAALDLGLRRSWLIGDQITDVAAARAAGLLGALYILTNHNAVEKDEIKTIAAHGFKIRFGTSIADAMDVISLITTH